MARREKARRARETRRGYDDWFDIACDVGMLGQDEKKGSSCVYTTPPHKAPTLGSRGRRSAEEASEKTAMTVPVV